MKDVKIDWDLFDVMAYLEDRDVDYYTAGSKNVSVGWIGIACPFCGDRSNHLGINLQSKKYSCFKCGSKGNVLTLIKHIDNCSSFKAIDIATKFVCKDFSHLKIVRKSSDKVIFPGGVSDNFLPIHDKFLEKRRYDRQFLQHKYDIRAIGPTCDDWKFRVVVPIYQNHELVSYVARDATNKAEIPYKNAPIEKSILQAKHCLYGIDEIRDIAVFVEGIFDKWRFGTYSVCTFGTQVTDVQLSLLCKKNIKKAFMLFDADAVSKAESLAYSVSSVVSDVSIIELEEGDPDDLTEDEIWELRRTIFK